MECLCWEQWLNLFCQNASPYSIILNRDSFCWVISSHSTLYLISTLFQLLSIVFGNLVVVSFLRFLDFILLKICWVSWIFSSTFNLIHISTLFLLLFMYPFFSLFPSEMDRWMNSNRLWAIVFSSPTLFWWLYFYVHESFLSWHVYVVLSIRKNFYVRYCCSYIFCKFHSWLLPSCFWFYTCSLIFLLVVVYLHLLLLLFLLIHSFILIWSVECGRRSFSCTCLLFECLQQPQLH